MVAASPYDDIPSAGRPDCQFSRLDVSAGITSHPPAARTAFPGTPVVPSRGDGSGAAGGSWRNGLQAGKYGSEH